MSHGHKLLALGVLLVVWGAPVMACLAPNARLTQAEKACCRDMAGQCGSMDMAAEHSCCQKAVSTQQVAVVTLFSVRDHVVVPAAMMAAQVTSALPTPEKFGGSPPSGRHPPPAPARSNEVLRI